MLIILTNGSHTMFLDQGNCRNHERSACAPHRPDELLPGALCFGAETVSHPLCLLLPCHGACIRPCWDAGTPATDSAAVAMPRTHPGAASSPLSARGIASIAPMEKRHIIALGTGWKPHSHMLALALLSSTWKGSESWGTVQGAELIEGEDVHTSCFSLNSEPVIQIACKTVQRPSHKAFSKIATGIFGAWRGVWDAGFWKWWDSWALRRDTVLEVNRGSNVLLCTPASNNLFLLNAAFFHYKNINL